MRHLKIFLTVAAAGALLTSCYERQFTPTLGSSAVEFVNASSEIQLTGEYINIPLQMTEQDSTAGAKAVIEFVGGTVTMTDGTSRDAVEFTNDQEGYEREGDIIITSKEIFLGAWNREEDGADGLSTSNLEVRVPDYRNIQTLVLNFEIVSDNAGAVRTTTVIAEKPKELVITGTWTIGGLQFSIEQDENGAYKFYTPFAEDPFGAVRDGNKLTIDKTGPVTQVQLVENGPAYDVNLLCWAYHDEAGGADGDLYIWDENVVITFNEDETLVLSNGLFIGFEDPEGSGGYYNFNGSAIAPGTTGTR